MQVKNELWQLVEFLADWPTGLGIFCRSLVYPLFLKEFPRRLRKRDMPKVYRRVRISVPGKMSVGSGASIQQGCLFMSEGGITIGRDVMIGPNCILMTTGHAWNRADIPMYDQPLSIAPIRIGDDVWLGAGVLLLPGVSVGRGAILGAGSVVTRDVPPMEIWAGNPARKLKGRGSAP